MRRSGGLEFLSKLPPAIPFDRCVGTELRLLITAFEIENMDLGVLVSVLLVSVILSVPIGRPGRLHWMLGGSAENSCNGP